MLLFAFLGPVVTLRYPARIPHGYFELILPDFTINYKLKTVASGLFLTYQGKSYLLGTKGMQ